MSYIQKCNFIYKGSIWRTKRKNKAELERVAFYHCDQVGTPQTLSNELGECIWEIKQDTWGTTLEIKTTEHDNPFGYSNIRFQGHEQRSSIARSDAQG